MFAYRHIMASDIPNSDTNPCLGKCLLSLLGDTESEEGECEWDRDGKVFENDAC